MKTASSSAIRCRCCNPLWERVCPRSDQRAVTDKPQRLNRWQASSHTHRIVAARFPYGSGFVCGGRTGLSLTNRSVLIAGKPAPTPIVAARPPLWERARLRWAHRAVTDKPQCLNRWQASSHAHRCCPHPLWEPARLRGAHRAVADKPQRLNRWQASSHAHRCCPLPRPYARRHDDKMIAPHYVLTLGALTTP